MNKNIEHPKNLFSIKFIQSLDIFTLYHTYPKIWSSLFNRFPAEPWYTLPFQIV